MSRRYLFTVLEHQHTGVDDPSLNETSVEKIAALFNAGVLTRSGAIECVDVFSKKHENARLHREFENLREKLGQTLPLKAEARSTEAHTPGLMG